MQAVELSKWLAEREVSDPLADILNDLLNALPANTSIESDVWDVIGWSRSIGNSTKRNIYFDVIKHNDLKLLCKLWVLYSRLISGNSSLASFIYRIRAFQALSSALGARKFSTLKTDDIYTAERWIRDNCKGTTPFRLSGFLQQASTWLSIMFNLRLDYKNRLVNPVVHGSYGNEQGREDKLIPDEVIRDIFEARHKVDLIKKDKFFLSILAISVATGFRVGEMATLPANCMLKLNDELHLLHYPKKEGKPIPRPIHPLLADVVEDAVNNILAETKAAREFVKGLRTLPQLDWARVLDDRVAFRYFTKKWAHDWTSDPNHKMINPDGAWYNRDKCFIDVIGAYLESGLNKVQAAKNLGLPRNTFYNLMESQEAARRGELPKAFNSKSRGQARTSWDTDQRVLSIMKFSQYCGVSLKQVRCEVIQDIIDEAQTLQLRGEIYPRPLVNKILEDGFQRKALPLLKDSSGNVILYQDEALLIVEKYSLSEQRETKKADFTYVTEGQIIRWLSGEKRSHGTGNYEDSVFNRLGIIDSRTGEDAKFTSHDIRHWLNTVYQNGGLTEDQIALIFNRKYKKQNATYDQTSNKVRTARLKQAVRDKVAIGQVSESYSVLAEYSREDAEDYLSAVLRMANPMPHGVCMLDWSTTPCPHNLSCFSCDDEKPCEHLLIDPSNDNSTKELTRIKRESELVANAIIMQGVDNSPTLDHFMRISRNVSIALDEVHQLFTNEDVNNENH